MTAKEKVLKVYPDATAKVFHTGRWIIYDPLELGNFRLSSFCVTEEAAWRNAAESLPPQPEQAIGSVEAKEKTLDRLGWEGIAGAIIDKVHMTAEDYVNEELVTQLKRFFLEPKPNPSTPAPDARKLALWEAAGVAEAMWREDDNRWNRCVRQYRNNIQQLVNADPKSTVEASDEYIRGFNRCKELAEGIVGGSEFHERIGYLDPVTSVEAKPSPELDAGFDEWWNGLPVSGKGSWSGVAIKLYCKEAWNAAIKKAETR